MNQRQMNNKHMMEATLSYLDQNSAVWQSIAKIGEVKNRLGVVNLAIDEAAELQDQSAVSIGKSKLALKYIMCEKADIVNDVVEVYAIMEGNNTLADKMADTASDLFKMKNDDMVRRVKMIIAKAEKFKDILVAEYGLTEEQITDLKADLNKFLQLNGLPREYQVKSSMATQSMADLFDEAKDLLANKLDNLMKVFKRRDPNFYHGYLKARMIVDL